MTDTDAQIKAAIDAFDIDTARALLRTALRDQPTADTYYFASLVAITPAQQQQFLAQAVELDPFHKEAVAQLGHLRAAAKPSAGQTPTAPATARPQPDRPGAAPYTYPAPAPAASGNTKIVWAVLLIAIAAVIFGGLILTSRSPRATANLSAPTRAFAPPTRAVPTATRTPHQLALASSNAAYDCDFLMEPSSSSYFSDPTKTIYKLDAHASFMVLETVSSDKNALLWVERSNGVTLAAPPSARALRESTDSDGKRIYYSYRAYYLGRVGVNNAPDRVTVFVSVPANVAVRFRCIQEATIRKYVDDVSLPYILNLNFLVEMSNINRLIKDQCGEPADRRCD